MEFHIGQRVKATRGWCGNHHIIGKSGTVITSSEGSCGVAFDEDVSGHRCNCRQCEMGHGWFVSNSILIPIDSFSSVGLEELI